MTQKQFGSVEWLSLLWDKSDSVRTQPPSLIWEQVTATKSEKLQLGLAFLENNIQWKGSGLGAPCPSICPHGKAGQSSLNSAPWCIEWDQAIHHPVWGGIEISWVCSNSTSQLFISPIFPTTNTCWMVVLIWSSLIVDIPRHQRGCLLYGLRAAPA